MVIFLVFKFYVLFPVFQAINLLLPPTSYKYIVYGHFGLGEVTLSTTLEHQNNIKCTLCFALDVVRFVVVRNIIGIYSSIVRWVFDVIVPAMLQCPGLHCGCVQQEGVGDGSANNPNTTPQ